MYICSIIGPSEKSNSNKTEFKYLRRTVRDGLILNEANAKKRFGSRRNRAKALPIMPAIAHLLNLAECIAKFNIR